MPNRRTSSQRRRRRRYRQNEYRTAGLLQKLIIMLAIVAAIVLGVEIFFRIHTVEVQGNSIYSREQVVEASGLEIGDNLLLVNRAAVAGSIKARMPYVRDVSVSPSMPDTVVIRLRESDVAALVKSDIGASWYINTGGRVMGSSVEGFRGQVIALSGFTISAPKNGQQAVAAEEKTEHMAAALHLLSQMEGTGLIGQITAVDVEKPYDIIAHIGDRLEVWLGSTENLEYKTQYLQVVLDELEEYQTGVIDLTFDVKQVARFIPRIEAASEEASADDGKAETEIEGRSEEERKEAG